MKVPILKTFGSACYTWIFSCLITISGVVVGGIFILGEIKIYDGIVNLVFILATGIGLLAVWVWWIRRHNLNNI